MAHRIDTTGSTDDGKFDDGDPAAGEIGTVVNDDWLNMVQEEIINVVLEAGITLDKSKMDQLKNAILQLIGDQINSRSLTLDRFDVSHTDFQAAANKNDIELFQLAAKGLLQGFVLILDESFAGGSISGYDVRVGVTGDFAKVVFDFDVTQASGAKKEVQLFVLEDPANATSIRVEAESEGDTLDASTQGQLQIHAIKGVLA